MKPFHTPRTYGKAALILLVSAALLPGCAKRAAPQPSAVPSIVTEQPEKDYAEGKELLTLVKTEEEAEQLAELYGIELVEYGNGLAVFHTEENPYDVIWRGEENGWPELEINYIVTVFDEGDSFYK